MLKHNQTLKEQCNGLVLFTSESCNLQCSYCEMANYINKERHHQEAINVKKSLLNGQYLNTIQKALQKLEINPLNITNLELWGQEPTLTIKDFSVMFPQLYLYCNNITNIMYSTNGVGYIIDQINFIKMLISIITQPTNFRMQFSFDGEFFSENTRGIKSQKILQNIKNFLLQLNNIDLGKNLKIEIGFHNVISADIINYYSQNDKKDELFDFLNNFSDLYNLFLNLNKNDNVTLQTFSCALVVPYNATVQEGKNLLQFYLNCDEVGQEIEYKFSWKGLPLSVSNKVSAINKDKILTFLQKLDNQKYFTSEDLEILETLSHQLNCGFNYGCLKIRYDGTLIHCQNALLGLTEQELTGRSDINHIIQSRKLTRGFFPNILTDSDEKIDKYLYQCNLHSEESFPQCFTSTCNLMALLLQTKQIDEKYKNPKEFLKCAYFLTLSASCIHNSMMNSGSNSGNYAGWIRFLCNGFMDIVQKEWSEYI